MLTGKVVMVGVTGGISAYKVVDVVSRLKKKGADVHVIMTESATHFVTPLTFREISGNPVHTNMWEEPKLWNVEHIALATRADLFVVAPATANMLAKMANGLADDLLSTTLLATKAPILLVPAMNTNMYLNPATQNNLSALRDRGLLVMEPEIGSMACGTEGVGRLPEPVDIVSRIGAVFYEKNKLRGLRVLVTAGGTREPIDPVRYIGNRSSGKMGYAIAAAAREMGAEVVLVSASATIAEPLGVEVVPVETAEEMREAVLSHFGAVDIVIKAAAVSDYRCAEPVNQKIKKNSDSLELKLVKNPDILAELGRLKVHQTLVGFAAETNDLLYHAAEKLKKKNVDMLVANDVTQVGAGFGTDTNIVRLFYRDGRIEELPLMTKRDLGYEIITRVITIRGK